MCYSAKRWVAEDTRMHTVGRPLMTICHYLSDKYDLSLISTFISQTRDVLVFLVFTDVTELNVPQHPEDMWRRSSR